MITSSFQAEPIYIVRAPVTSFFQTRKLGVDLCLLIPIQCVGVGSSEHLSIQWNRGPGVKDGVEGLAGAGEVGDDEI